MLGNTRERILILLRILTDETDEEHTLTMPELQSRLGRYGIAADRRAIYEDIEALKGAGLEVLRDGAGKRGYFLASRDFEDAELSMLIDSIYTYRFLPQYQSDQLIQKLLRLGTPTFLMKHAFRKKPLVFDKKGGNTRVLYLVDSLSRAIARRCPVSFAAFHLDWHRRRAFDSEKPEVVLPLQLAWYGDNYFLIGVRADGAFCHYSVDRIAELELREDISIPLQGISDDEIRLYAQFTFGPTAGELVQISFRCKKQAAELAFERFGSGIPIYSADEESFRADASVDLNPELYAWFLAHGDQVELLGPDVALRGLKNLLELRTRQYE